MITGFCWYRIFIKIFCVNHGASWVRVTNTFYRQFSGFFTYRCCHNPRRLCKLFSWKIFMDTLHHRMPYQFWICCICLLGIIIITTPDCCCVIWCIASKYRVTVLCRCTCLTCCRHVRKPCSWSGTRCDYILHGIGQQPCCCLLQNFFWCVLCIIQKNIAIVIQHLCI